MRTRSLSPNKPIIADPNADVLATDDGEERDNSESGGLTKSTFVIGGTSEKKRKATKIAPLTSGAVSAAAVRLLASENGDDLLPLLPLPARPALPPSSPASPPSLGDEGEGETDDLLALVATEEVAIPTGDPDATSPGDAAPKPRRRTRTEPELGAALVAENEYRFPGSKTVLQILPDMPGTFGLRVAFRRGKTTVAVFQTTPLRSAATIRCRGQHFPVFLLQHARKKRDRVLFGAKRRTAPSWRCAVRCAAAVTGRDDKLTWFWRVTATAAALAQPVSGKYTDEAATGSLEAVRISLPFAPAKVHVLTLPGAEGRGLVARVGDIAVSVVARRGVLSAGEDGLSLTLENADLSGSGETLEWETWLSPVKTDAEAVIALAQHVADASDRAQTPPTAPPLLRRIAETCERELMRSDIIEKRGADKNVFRVAPHRADLLLAGRGADGALAAHALLNRFFLSGDDALRIRARLLANGVCEFQNNDETSAHWGAMWDALVRKTTWGDEFGKRILSLQTTARAAKGLQRLQAHFGVDLYERTALGAAQWLLLRLERDGLPQGERFAWDGKPVGAKNGWAAGEALIPLAETFRATKNEVYLRTALRAVGTLQAQVADGTLTFDTASSEQLAAVVEGVLLVSREYEQPELIRFADRIGGALRARRLPDGTITDPADLGEPVQTDLPHLAATLAGGRAALALSRVDKSPLWPVFALRAVRAAAAMLGAYSGYVNASDRGALLSLSMSILVAVAARAGGVPDFENLHLKRDWQTFAPDPATRDYVRVTAVGGADAPADDAPDSLALVCQATKQVLIAVLAPAGTAAVEIVKNGKRPAVRNLLTGDFDANGVLVPLEATGTEGMIGVFLAET